MTFKHAILLIAVMLFSCTEVQRNNPCDENGTNYRGMNYRGCYSSEPPNIPSNIFTDSRDGKVYKFVQIGGQIWMAENLNYEASSSKCYDNSEGNCDKYGRLYNWTVAMTVCPTGWHIPSDEEWITLIDYVGGSSIAGARLKATKGWKSGNGQDTYGFTALPGGDGDLADYFFNVGDNGAWWTATESNSNASNASYRYMRYISDEVYRKDSNKNNNLYSVRCVQD